jgi:hypothetical protein
VRRARSRDINFHPVVAVIVRSSVFAIDADNPSLLTSSTISVASPNAAACPQSISRRIRPPFARNVRPRRGPEPCSSQWEYGTRCKWHWHVHGYTAAFVGHTGSSAFYAGTNWTVCSTQRCHVATELESNCRCLFSVFFPLIARFCLFSVEAFACLNAIIRNSLCCSAVEQAQL